MRTKTLLVFSLIFILPVQAQWFQYAKPNQVNQMVKDGSGNYHYATDIGYVKFDNSFNVVDYKNLVSQSPPIGNVTSLDINPLNDQEIAICEPDRVTVWTNGVLTQTIEFDAPEPDYTPQIYFNNNNEIYVFDKSQNDYKIISNGVISDVVTPGIRPQAIVENNAGTKVYFAGWNNGLWEYTKATDTWVNYNESNSNLIYDPLESLFITDNDDLYIGGFQGLNVMDSSGTMTACQQSAGSGSPFFFSAFEIDVNANGDVLVRSSKPNGGANFGFCLVDTDTCSWTNFSDGGTNCLDSNSFRTVQFSSSGNEVIATKTVLDLTETYTFDINAPTTSCTELDFNYLGATDMYRSFSFSEVSIRESNAPGNFDIALTNDNGIDIISLPEENFNGVFPTATNFNAFSGFPYDIISAGEYYVFTDSNNSFTFLNRDGTSTSHTLPIQDFSINITKKANVDVSGSTCTLVFSGWEGPSFDTKVYITECDMPTGNCTVPIEIFSNNRDTTQPITFTCTEDAGTDNLRCVAIKQSLNNSLSGGIALTEETISPENGTETIVSEVDIGSILTSIFVDPIFQKQQNQVSTEVIVPDEEGETVTVYNSQSGTLTTYNLDNGTFRVTLYEYKAEDPRDQNAFNPLLAFGIFTRPREFLRKQFNNALWGISNDADRSQQSTTLPYTEIPGSVIADLPPDMFIYSIKIYPYSNTEYATVLMTNYGLLIKSEIDYSFFTLGIENNESALDFKLYPNPTKNIITVDGPGIESLSVFDSSGRLVLNTTNTSVELSEWPSGIYFVKAVNHNGQITTKKFVKL